LKAVLLKEHWTDFLSKTILFYMLAEWHIAEADWQHTPPSVRTALFSLSHQLRLLRIRCAAYEHRARELERQLARTSELEAKVVPR